MAERKVDDATLQAAFSMWDLDGSGSISVGELGKMLRACRLNPTERDVNRMCKKYDADKSGQIDFGEFKKLYQEVLRDADTDPTAVLRESFQAFDVDGNGFIDAAELQYVLTTLGEPLTDKEARALIASVDVNADGKLDYNEFVQLLANF